MASLFDADLHDVREGFLCPVCQLDQGSSSQLQLHYEIAHLNEASNPSAGVSLKGSLLNLRCGFLVWTRKSLIVDHSIGYL